MCVGCKFRYRAAAVLGYRIVESYDGGSGQTCNSNNVCHDYLRPFDAIHVWTYWIFSLIVGEIIVHAMRRNDRKDLESILAPVMPFPAHSDDASGPKKNSAGGDMVGCGTEEDSKKITDTEPPTGPSKRGGDSEADMKPVNGTNWLNVIGAVSAIVCIGATAGIFST